MGFNSAFKGLNTAKIPICVKLLTLKSMS